MTVGLLYGSSASHVCVCLCLQAVLRGWEGNRGSGRVVLSVRVVGCCSAAVTNVKSWSSTCHSVGGVCQRHLLCLD